MIASEIHVDIILNVYPKLLPPDGGEREREMLSAMIIPFARPLQYA